jgi:hypothetical protein
VRLSPLLWAIVFCSHLGFQERQGWWISILWQDWVCLQVPMTFLFRQAFPDQSWDNDQRSYTFDWNCSVRHTFCPLPQFFLYFNLKLMSVPQRWAEMFNLPFPVCGWHVNKFPSLTFTTTGLFNWCIGASVEARHVGSLRVELPFIAFYCFFCPFLY